jgi:hypothetical protein
MEGGEQVAKRMEWTPQVETLLASWCDHAKCFVWMHSRAHDEAEHIVRRYLWVYHTLSTLAGLSNIITGDVTIGTFKIAWFFGGLTVLLTSLSLLQEKLGFNEKALNHRKLAIQALVIKMKIEEMLSIPRAARGDCKTFLRYIKGDINQSMVEKNAAIPPHIRKACFDEFSKIPNFDIPDVCGQVEHTSVYLSIEDTPTSVGGANTDADRGESR